MGVERLSDERLRELAGWLRTSGSNEWSGPPLDRAAAAIDELLSLRAARAPEGLREMLGHILDESEDEIIDWLHAQSRRSRPVADDVIRRILALFQATGPVMPETPRDAAWVAATDAIGEAIKLGVSPSHAAYHAIRDRLIAEQKEPK